MFKPNLIKCPFCVGQNNKNRKTLYLYPDGFWCARCKKSGHLMELGELEIEWEIERKVTYNPNSLVYNNEGKRFSVCRNRHYAEGVDSFESKKHNGAVVGKHLRLPDKISKTVGSRYFGYRQDFLHLSEIYRVVEGPYDCIYPNDICVFGIPSDAQSTALKNYKLILCPDGDIWMEKEKLVSWLRPFLWNNIVSVERCKGDPDETPLAEREILDWKSTKSWVWKQIKS